MVPRAANGHSCSSDEHAFFFWHAAQRDERRNLGAAIHYFAWAGLATVGPKQDA